MTITFQKVKSKFLPKRKLSSRSQTPPPITSFFGWGGNPTMVGESGTFVISVLKSEEYVMNVATEVS